MKINCRARLKEVALTFHEILSQRYYDPFFPVPKCLVEPMTTISSEFAESIGSTMDIFGWLFFRHICNSTIRMPVQRDYSMKEKMRMLFFCVRNIQ